MLYPGAWPAPGERGAGGSGTRRKKEVVYIEGERLLRYSLQLSMLKRLLNLKMINEQEYELIRKKLMQDYGVVSDITA